MRNQGVDLCSATESTSGLPVLACLMKSPRTREDAGASSPARTAARPDRRSRAHTHAHAARRTRSLACAAAATASFSALSRCVVLALRSWPRASLAGGAPAVTPPACPSATALPKVLTPGLRRARYPSTAATAVRSASTARGRSCSTDRRGCMPTTGTRMARPVPTRANEACATRRAGRNLPRVRSTTTCTATRLETKMYAPQVAASPAKSTPEARAQGSGARRVSDADARLTARAHSSRVAVMAGTATASLSYAPATERMV
mmetsp:Transcript_6508/g.18990  ORF Transcript_6508/g.18990 Transcript_6508/m.18990 type:complete len:262 (-) Transcript_6508:475-1260(-)